MSGSAVKGETFSYMTVNGKRLPWKELDAHRRAENADLKAWRMLVRDLDRCKHGRHEGDACIECGGESVGNIEEGTVIGWDLSGNPYIMPSKSERHEFGAW